MNEYAPSLSKLQHEESLRKPYAGNLHVRFDEEEGAACPPLLTLLPFVVNHFTRMVTRELAIVIE